MIEEFGQGRHYLYRHIRLDTNEVFYIGVGTKPKKNYNVHICIYKRAFEEKQRTKFWKRVAYKSGYEIEIMFESNDISFIFEKEKEFIQLYGRRDLGKGTLCNLTDGGEGRVNVKVSPITREKQSIKKKGRKLSKESIHKRTITRRTRTKERGYYAPPESFERRMKMRFNTMVPIEKQEKIIEMVKSGITLEKIASHLETHYQTIKKILTRENIDYKYYRNESANKKDS